MVDVEGSNLFTRLQTQYFERELEARSAVAPTLDGAHASYGLHTCTDSYGSP
jgi:hypothetical protein